MVRLTDDLPRQRRRLNVPMPSRLQQRFEGSRIGEVLISGFVLVFILINVSWNLPPSEVQRRAQPVLTPLAALTGAGQGWSMYAPDPVRRLETVDVIVTMPDGSNRIWTPKPEDHATLFVWCHWHKLKETAVRRPELRAGIADWVVRELTEPAEHPTRVEMILRTQSLPPPGTTAPAETKTETLYNKTLTTPP